MPPGLGMERWGWGAVAGGGAQETGSSGQASKGKGNEGLRAMVIYHRPKKGASDLAIGKLTWQVWLWWGEGQALDTTVLGRGDKGQGS